MNVVGANPPAGFGPKLHMVWPIRVKGSTGSFNVGRRGELSTWRQVKPGFPSNFGMD